MKKTYAWKMGMTMPIKPDVAGTIFEKICKEKGELQPEYVVDEARPEASPLHNWFEWDDPIAAEKYRRHQASELIRCNVVLLAPDDKPIGENESRPITVNAANTTRSFVNIRKANGEKAYLPVQTVMEDVDLRQQYIHRAYKEITDWKIRYRSIKAFSGIVAAIENTKLEAVLASS